VGRRPVKRGINYVTLCYFLDVLVKKKCLIFQKTICGVKFYKEHLEVIVAIKDTNESAVEEFFEGQAGQLAAKIREGAVNPDAPQSIIFSS
jgi:hypothetical protein